MGEIKDNKNTAFTAAKVTLEILACIATGQKVRAKSEVKSANEPDGLCGLTHRFPNLEAKKGIIIALR